MGESASRSGTVVPTSCKSCGGERELVRNGERTAARCAKCESVEDVDIVCAVKRKWTVVDPDGEVRTFEARPEMEAFVRGDASASAKPDDASAEAKSVDDDAKAKVTSDDDS
jgi:hypothetical protein